MLMYAFRCYFEKRRKKERRKRKSEHWSLSIDSHRALTRLFLIAVLTGKAAAIRGPFSSLKHDCSFQTERRRFYLKLRLCALAAIDFSATRPCIELLRFQEDILGRRWLNNENLITKHAILNLITRDRVDFFSMNFLNFRSTRLNSRGCWF